MIQFNLNIDLFYEYELKSGSSVKAIATIEYPVIHIIAKTVEVAEEEYDELDRFIVQTAHLFEGIQFDQFAALTGLSPDIFKYRAREMERQQYLSIRNEAIIPLEEGIKFIQDSSFKREVQKTRSFLVDGITLKPLVGHFYKDGKEYLISSEDKDSFGNKIFNPAIIHNPPSKQVLTNIIEIAVDQRAHYNIPVGLKEILDFDFVLMTYPVGVVLSRTAEGITQKKLVDLNGFYSNEANVSEWQKLLTDDVGRVEILIEDKQNHSEAGAVRKQFRNNWARFRTAEDGRIFSITRDNFKHFITRNFGVQGLDERNLQLDGHTIELIVDKVLFETEGVDKKKLIEACVRGRDYIRQNPGSGVWLVFVKVTIGDRYVQSLIDLYKLLTDKKVSCSELLIEFENDYILLRQSLIAIERFDELEELDTYLFLGTRESSFVRRYLTIEND